MHKSCEISLKQLKNNDNKIPWCSVFPYPKYSIFFKKGKSEWGKLHGNIFIPYVMINNI